jgi:hypothetical protein
MAASTTDLTVYDENAPNIASDFPTPNVGYGTEMTDVLVQVTNLHNDLVYPTTTSAVEAFFTLAGCLDGAACRNDVTIASCSFTPADDDHLATNSIGLTMPPYEFYELESLEVTLTIRLAQQTSVLATTTFTYYPLPSTSPILQRAAPLSGKVSEPQDVQVELTGFYKTNNVAAEFVDESMQDFLWKVNSETVVSSIEQTQFTVSSPVVWDTSLGGAVYNEDGSSKIFEVRLYPAALATQKDFYGSTFTWYYEKNTPYIDTLSPTAGLVIGGVKVTIDLKNVALVPIEEVQTLLTITVGDNPANPETFTATEILNGPQRDIMRVVSEVPASANIGLVDVDVQFDDSLKMVDTSAVDAFEY